MSQKLMLHQLKTKIVNYNNEVKKYQKEYNCYEDDHKNCHYRYIYRNPYMSTLNINIEIFQSQILRRELDKLGNLDIKCIRLDYKVNADEIVPDNNANYSINIQNSNCNFELYFYQMGSIKKELKKEIERRIERYWLNYVLNNKIGLNIE
jgi:hypothetical protein